MAEARHRQSRRELRAELGKIRVALQAAKAQALSAEESEPLIKLLCSWLMDHVLKEFMLLKDFLRTAS